MQKADVGVIVGRFQVHTLHAAHKELIDGIYNSHPQTIIVLGLSPVRVSINNPLDFEARRRMLQESYPNASVVYINDHPSDAEWSKNLDRLVGSLISPSQSVCLYGGRDSFLHAYSGHYPTQELEQKNYVSGTETRRTITRAVKATEDFRAGVIWASANMYPKVHPTVDVAVFDEQYVNILLVRKATEDKWRFPGGFAAPTDLSYEMTARREVSEELGVNLSISDPEYITSAQIDDWRYRGETDKILTMLFVTKVIYGSPTPADDVDFAKWFPITDNIRGSVVAEHQPLIDAVLHWRSRR